MAKEQIAEFKEISTDVDYKKLMETHKETIKKLQSKISSLEAENDSYKLSGRVKLFYAINKQQNDLADMLNSIELKNVDLAKPTDKTVERLKIIWSSIGVLSPIVNELRLSAGVTGDEDKDISARKPFVDTIAVSR
jgi:hypothetical protein